jgi:hypothetical protein
MAEDKPLSTKDLFLLLIGLYRLKEVPSGNLTAEQFWLKDGALRETEWNPLWLGNPKLAWKLVRHRDWLMGNIAANLVDHKQDFTAISENMLISLDVLTNEFKPRMPGITPAIEKIVFKDGYERSFLTALSLGLSKRSVDNKEVILLGAGIRRRTRIWLTGDDGQALQADVELFVPFYVAPAEGQKADDTFPDARAICAGISLSRVNGSSIGVDKDGKDLAGMRFNLRLPFTPQKSESEKDLVTSFGLPEVNVQKRSMETKAVWKDFADWKKFVEDFCTSNEGGELLNAPIGPLLLETVSDSSGVTDILLNKEKLSDLKKELKEVQAEVKEALGLLKNLWDAEEPGKGIGGDTSSMRRLGGLLDSIGFLEGKGSGAGKYKYKLRDLDKLTVWDVVNHAVTELEGFPLYIKGLDPKEPDSIRGAVTLAAKRDEIDINKQYFGLAGLVYNIPVKESAKGKSKAKDNDPDAVNLVLDEENFTKEDDPKSKIEMKIHLGKWFEGETLDDNWFRRLLPSGQSAWKQRVPLPGIRLLPLKRVQDSQTKQAAYSLALRGELLSIGFDIKGDPKEGLTFLNLKKGPLAYFGLGAIETRLALLVSADHVAIGAGIKLKNLRLSLGPKEAEEDENSEENILGALKHLFAEDDALPEPEEEENPLKTRLGGKKIDKFSLSVGYLSPLSLDSHGTLDIQLYDKKGNRGKMVWIPVDRQPGTVYVKHIGIGLKDVENVELGKDKGLSDSAQLTVALTGGFRFPVFELGFIGAKLILPLNNPGKLDWGLDGLDVSLKIGPAVISGSFLKSGLEYAGSLTIDLPKFSIGAMGYYGNLAVFSKAFDKEVLDDLKNGKLHTNLLKELEKNQIKPASPNSVRQVFGSTWEIATQDDTRYSIVDHEGKLNVLSYNKSLFIYGTLSAASGGGVKIGPFEFTAIALGFGLNRRIKVPSIENVASFPLVTMVMGKGGLQDSDSNDLRDKLGKPIKNPVEVLEKMKDWLPAERGQYFICAGVRFTIATAVDCFALLIVQFGNDLEITLLGLARFRLPGDLDAEALCYIEMQLLMTIKPSEGSFKLQALLTGNSWIINKNCKLTGGFALFAWFAGEHKGDFVITLGGYHPRFKRPSHYPMVPRLGLNWTISDSLSIKGGVYMATTPSCRMIGGKLEASFQSGRVSAWFTIYLDAIMAWSPLHFELDIGISMRIEATFFLLTLKLAISASVEMWGPPVGGVARVKLTLISFDLPIDDVEFGTKREAAKPKLIGSWAQFCRSFLNASEEHTKINDREIIDTPMPAFPTIQPSLASGLNNQINQDTQATPQEADKEESNWKVRGDQLDLAASASIPVTTLNLGYVKIDSMPEGIQESDLIGKPLLVPQELAFETEGLQIKQSRKPLGVHPMGKKLASVLNVTIVRDAVSATESVDVSQWAIEEETASLPAGLWDAAKPDPKGPSEPSAKLIPGCITGIKRLKPPAGKRGQQASLSKIEWHQLDPVNVSRSGKAQSIPKKAGSRNVQTVMADKQAARTQVFDALSELGFILTRQPAQTETRFRELQATPLTYADGTPL